MADFEEATNDGEQEEEEEEEEQASPEEKLQIVQHLLLSSPPGEFDDVLSDAMALVPGDLVSRPMLAGIARAYNNANPRCARAADGTLVLLSRDYSDLGGLIATFFNDNIDPNPSSRARYSNPKVKFVIYFAVGLSFFIGALSSAILLLLGVTAPVPERA